MESKQRPLGTQEREALIRKIVIEDFGGYHRAALPPDGTLFTNYDEARAQIERYSFLNGFAISTTMVDHQNCRRRYSCVHYRTKRNNWGLPPNSEAPSQETYDKQKGVDENGNKLRLRKTSVVIISISQSF
jgi:hypothetical protein